MEQIRISAKALGEVAMPDFCPKCFYIKLHTKKLPWQIFPGIFSSIDAYTKKVAHAWIEREAGNRPEFIDKLGVTAWLKAPHWSKFTREYADIGITLSGGVDDLWLCGDRVHIPDYKTAKYTANQDKLLPMYHTQLNSYAAIAEAVDGIPPVSGISLIYMEPQTDIPLPENAGFLMEFKPTFMELKLESETIPPLLEKVRKIYDMLSAPDGSSGCKDCEALNAIAGLTS